MVGDFFILQKQAGTIKQRISFALTCAAMVASNFLIKAFLYHSTIFQGTGGQPLAINLRSILTLLSEALLSILGVNHGPQYLIGSEWSDFSFLIRSASIAFFTISLGLVLIAFIRRDPNQRVTAIHWPYALLALILLLLLPSILTIRMEPRWEVAPFFILLLLISCGAGRLMNTNLGKKSAFIMMAVLSVGSAIIESRVSQSFNSISFVSGGIYADSVKHAIVDTKLSPPGESLILVTHSGNCIGTLIDGGFFLVYEGKRRTLDCVPSLADANPTNYPQSSRIFASNSANQLVDFTNEWRSGKPISIP